MIHLIEVKNWSGRLDVQNGVWCQTRRNGQVVEHPESFGRQVGAEAGVSEVAFQGEHHRLGHAGVGQTGAKTVQAEVGMAARVTHACEDLRSAGTSPAGS